MGNTLLSKCSLKTTDNQTHDKNKKIHLVALTKLRLMSYRIPFEYIQMGYKLVAT